MPVVDPAGALPLPWLAGPLQTALARQRGHATLVHATPGLGALEFVLVLAQSLLCEAPSAAAVGSAQDGRLACGVCGSCRLVQAGLHPDLFVLLPEIQRRETGWLIEGDKAEGEELKRKPSKQIRIAEVRLLIDWTHRTSARGRGKVIVLHPADRLNDDSASALLKTLEEPAQGTRLLLTTADPNRLLPTVRSRCQSTILPVPAAAEAAAWLAGQGVAEPAVLLAACNGRPMDALALARAGVDAAAWRGLPQALARGRADALAGWSPPLLVDALQKLCHDALARAVGGAVRYFPADAWGPPPRLEAVLGFATTLARVARHAEHPWSEPLLFEALLAEGRQALSPGAVTLLR